MPRTKASKRLIYLIEKISEWNGDGFTTQEFLEWAKEGKCPQWLRYGGARRLVAYLTILKRLKYLQLVNGRWRINKSCAPYADKP